MEENDWKREIQEGGVLLGTAILGFEAEVLIQENHSAELIPKFQNPEKHKNNAEESSRK